MPTKTGRYYIIEHPHKGVLHSIDAGPVPRYSRTARRNSPKMMRFTDLRQATDTARFLMNQSLEQAGKFKRLTIFGIRKAPDFKLRCWDCGGWLSFPPGRELGHRRGCPHIGGGD